MTELRDQFIMTSSRWPWEGESEFIRATRRPWRPCISSYDSRSPSTRRVIHEPARLSRQINLVNGALANVLLCDSALHSSLHIQ
jgi:hypothetical protein